jgi:hypothetical protein
VTQGGGELTRRRVLVLAMTAGGAAGVAGLAWARIRGAEPEIEVAGAPTSTTGPAPAVETAPAPTAPDTVQAPTEPAPPPPVSFAVLCQQAWGGTQAAPAAITHEIVRISVHHSAVPLPDNRGAPERIRSHQAAHRRSGFSDIAYHLIIDRNGHVYQGRDPAVPGESYTDYDPTGHFLVMAEGNFEEEQVSDAQRASLVRVLAWASDHYGVAPVTVSGHRDHAATLCPGANLYGPLADGSLLAEVARMMEVGAPVRRDLCDGEAAEIVAAITDGRA